MPTENTPNGQIMVPFGPEADDIVPLPVAAKMLELLLDRDDVLFTVLIGEAMTGVRLAKTRARMAAADQAADAEPAQ